MAKSGKACGRALANNLGPSFAGDGISQWAMALGKPSTADISGPVTAYSFAAWVSPTSATSAGAWLGGRNGSWRLGLSPDLLLQAPVAISDTSVLGGGYNYAGIWPTTPEPLAKDVSYFVIVSWDNADLAVWINGVKITTVRSIGGYVPATSNPFQLFWNGSAVCGGANIQGAFALSRAITAGEARELYELGTIAPPLLEAVQFNQQGSSALTEQYPSNAGCAACGGTMSTVEASITNDAGSPYHPGCYAARQVAKPALAGGFTARTTPLQASGEICKLLWDITTYYIRRPTLQHLAYLDPSSNLFVGFSSPGVALPDDATDQYAMTETGFAAIAARLAWYGKAPATSWLVTAAKQIINGFLAAQPLTPGHVPAGLETQMFFPVQLAETTLLLKLYLSTEELTTWTNALLTFMNDWYLSEYFPYYANANFECQYLYLNWLTYKLTGDQSWMNQYQKQYNWMVAPSSVAVPSSKNNAIGRGLIYTQQPTRADGSDGKGFLTEAGSATTITKVSLSNPAVVTVSESVAGICPARGNPYNKVVIAGSGRLDGAWTPTPLSSTTFSIPIDNVNGAAYSGGATAQAVGFDPYYSLLQLSVLSNLFSYSRDPQVLRLLNLVCNQSLTRVNSEDWIMDCTNGTRKSFYQGFGTASYQTLRWLGGRSDFSAEDVAAQWNVTYSFIRTSINGAEVPGGRDANYMLGGLLLTSPDWPGLP